MGDTPRGIFRRVQVELDKGSAQRMMTDTEKVLALAGEKGAKGMGRALREDMAVEIAKLHKDLAQNTIDRKTFDRLERELKDGYNRALTAGMDKLKAAGKLTDAEFVRLARDLQKVGKVGKDGAEEAAKGWGKFGEVMKGVGAGLVGGILGGGAVDLVLRGIGAVKDFIFSVDDAATDSENVANHLAGTLATVGIRFADVREQIEAGGRDLQARTEFDDEVYMQVLDSLIQGTNDYSASVREVGTVLDLAAGKHIEWAEAGKYVARAMTDPTFSLNRLGIAARDGETAIEAIRRSMKGMAENDAKSFSGGLAQATNAWNNFKEAAGSALHTIIQRTGILQQAATWLNQQADSFSDWFQKNGDEAAEMAKEVKEAAFQIARLAEIALKGITFVIRVESQLESWYRALPRPLQWLMGGPLVRSLQNTGTFFEWTGAAVGAVGRAGAALDRGIDRMLGRGPRTPQRGPAPAATTPPPAAVPGGDGRLDADALAQMKEMAELRHLNAAEVRSLRAEQAALNRDLHIQNLTKEAEISIRQRLKLIDDTLNPKKKREREERDAQKEELDQMREVVKHRELDAHEVIRLIALSAELTRQADSHTLSVKAEAAAREKIAEIAEILAAPAEREIANAQEALKYRHLTAEEVGRLIGLERQLTAEQARGNLTAERKLQIEKHLADLRAMMPAPGDVGPATREDRTARTQIRRRGQTDKQEHDDAVHLSSMRQELDLLAGIARYRTLTADEAARAADIEAELRQRLADGNVSAQERLDLYKDIADAEQLADDTSLSWDNLHETMVSSAASAADAIAESWEDVFARVFRGGMNLRGFLLSMWKGTAKALAEETARKAKVHSAEALMHALKATGTALYDLAIGDARGASLAGASAVKFAAEAAGWAALGGGAMALAGGGGAGAGGGGGSDTPLPSNGRDAGQDLARQAETHIYFRVENHFDPLDGNSPRVQDFMYVAGRGVVQRYGGDAFGERG